jgi:hypothetical protein
MLSLWRCHCLSDGNPPITTKCPKVLYALKFWQSWGHVGWKKALYGYTCLFLFLCIYCGDSCQLSISAVYAWNPRHSLMQTKATISLENREKLEGVKSASWLRWAFLFCKHDCCNFDLPIIFSLFLLTIFNQDILFTAQTETINLLGSEWSVLVLVSGGCMFSSQLKVAVTLPSQSMRTPWKHNNQPVIVIVINI